jgi:hypothetical protein
VRALLIPLFASSAWAQSVTMLAGTTNEGAALASSLDRPVPSQRLRWRARHLSAQLRPLFIWSAWAQAVNVVAARRGEGVALDTDCMVGECSYCQKFGGRAS